MKRWMLNVAICFVGLALVIGCGGGDDDGDGGGSANLDAETEDVLEVLQEVMGDMGSFVSLSQVTGKRIAAMAATVPIDRAFFNEPVNLPGATGGSAVRNGNMHGSISVTAGETSGSATLTGNYQTMITFSSVTTQSGGTVNGRLSQAGTMSGNVSVSLSNAGSGSFEFTDTVASQPDFTVNGSSVSILLDTTYVITFANGAATTSGRQMGIINGQSVNRTF